ncbi:RING finger protein 122-like [Scleropages formosus]|uniref:RING finger protein 122-like n=1 Tax=Scleropages formosus TaxID=113540 RepID=A0A0P7VIT1_SCLFO|nr:RING finger protein 122-like [Scleropages formosus]
MASKLRHQAQSERFGYREVILRDDAKKLSLHGFLPKITVGTPCLCSCLLSSPSQQTCAVCLEDFKVKDELGVLPCQHAFHRKCLVKWLEVRCVCPMCNKPIAGPPEPHQSIGTLLDELDQHTFTETRSSPHPARTHIPQSASEGGVQLWSSMEQQGADAMAAAQGAIEWTYKDEARVSWERVSDDL